MKKFKLLVACEESQRVCAAFREREWEAYSCDIEPCSGGHPEWHIMQDVLPLLNGNCEFMTADRINHKIDGEWDLIIAHPPCTYLTVTGNRWFNVEKYGNNAIKRMKDREDAIEFFMAFTQSSCKHIAIENPVGVMSTVFRKPNQIIQPYMFGDAVEKKTCLWTVGLPNLTETNVVTPPERVRFGSGKSMSRWYADAWRLSKEERSKIRSKTFPGIANAMADQWGSYVENYGNK